VGIKKGGSGMGQGHVKKMGKEKASNEKIHNKDQKIETRIERYGVMGR